MKNKNAVALGSKRSLKKATSSRNNGSNWHKPHFKKCRYFEKNYPYSLKSNEWKEKFSVAKKTPTGKWMTYNPDYYCPSTGYFIEVVTSKPNISEQGWKWRRVLIDGLKLKIYWWEGQEITDIIKKGGYPQL